MNESILWQIRHFVYGHFAGTTHHPTVDVTAAHFNISTEEAGEYYKELYNRHALFLDLETLTIRMANPFSGIPTDFKVHANGKTYYANCAWDMLGIPAAIHTDAVIEAVCTESNESVQLEIKNGQVTYSDLLVHFPLPFSHWYDDLVFTGATMLLFQSEEWIDKWCKRNNLQRGEVLTLQQVWELSKLWYDNRLSLEYHGRSADQVAEIFKQAGLTSKFWHMK